MSDTARDTDDTLILLAQLAAKDVERSLGKNLWPAASSLARVVETLAERLAELTVEVRQLKTHDTQPENGNNAYGTYRGVCTCGWESAYDQYERVAVWITKHRAIYDEPSPPASRTEDS